jgi:hypothetical protein
MTTVNDTFTSSPMVLSSKHLVERQKETEVELSPTLLAAIDDGAIPMAGFKETNCYGGSVIVPNMSAIDKNVFPTPGLKITNCYRESNASYLPMPPLGFILTDQVGGLGVFGIFVSNTWK